MTVQATDRVANRPPAPPVSGRRVAHRVPHGGILKPGGTKDADWAGHLAVVRDFWSSIMLTGGRYHGNPHVAHFRLPNLEPEMFDRWLNLFRATCTDLIAPEVAAAFARRAERIAQNPMRGLGSRSIALREEASR